MCRAKYLLALAAGLLLSPTAFAADLPLTQSPPADFSGWYLRGEIGFSNQEANNLNHASYDIAGIATQHRGPGVDSAGIFGLGVGYQFNNWFRTDVTGEYRGGANVNGVDLNIGSKSEWLALANVYADLGTWWSVTPFIGAGVGMARNTISRFTDVDPQIIGTTFGNPASKWNFAWAVHAGVAYSVSPGLTIEMAYRYVDLGDAHSGDLVTHQKGNEIYNSMEPKRITSHDLKFDVRWLLDPAPIYAPPPLITKG